ncbi:hypothetical protein C8Q80DRAFT_1130466 [Daedaleopsis nitida]|nr:hypothetical protein C8Q80DRAFT_1130466 [Daedaleopsis nitida]
MPSVPAFRALCALLILGLASARAFYMPPTFDATALPGYANTSFPPSNTDPSRSAGAGDTGTAQDAVVAFNHRNYTCSAASRRAVSGSGATQTATGMDSDSKMLAGGKMTPRDVWAPHITAPEDGTVWKVGETVQVTWDTSDRPEQVTNPQGKVVLGYLEDGNEDNEHLDFKHPLADGFDLSSGCVQVEVPDVDPSENYIVVLFGDSGDKSPMFTIVN